MAKDKKKITLSLGAEHVSSGAEMGDFGGWEMPLSYTGAIDEAERVRRNAGIFDISNTARIRIRGDGALDLIERVFTADAAHQEDDTALYTLACNDNGGILDDGLLHRLDGYWLYTANPINREKMLEHLKKEAENFGAKVDDQTAGTSQLLICGPDAEEILARVLPVKITGMAAGQIRAGSLMIARYVALRRTLGGLWAVEIMLPNMFVGRAWKFITQKAGADSILPAGQLAMDILRMEAGTPRYGMELNETIDPVTARLGNAVDFEHEFIGSQAIARIMENPPARKRITLTCAKDTADSENVFIPPAGSAVKKTDGTEAGTITSATFSPMHQKVIAAGYVSTDSAENGTELDITDGEKSVRFVVN